MKYKKWGTLVDKIEMVRYEMYQANQREPHNTKKLLQISRRLDKLIYQYQKQQTHCHKLQ